MFDVGFWELSILGIVTLLVVGPERLPELARVAGKWISKARRMVYTMRTEIEREVELAELRKLQSEVHLNELDDLIKGAHTSPQRARAPDGNGEEDLQSAPHTQVEVDVDLKPDPQADPQVDPKGTAE